MKKLNLILSLLFPIIILVALIVYRQSKIIIGKEIILPIAGFDPRDILSGHYLRYNIIYGQRNDSPCYDYNNDSTDAYICLNEESSEACRFSSDIYLGQNAGENLCYAIIKGKCEHGRFTADIEKFYIPEQYAVSLDKAVRNRKGSIVLSVSANGSAAIKDLLIDGKPWKEYKN